MKILKIIHGYPPLFNAGSEIYSQILVHGLADLGHQIAVFTRFEDPFIPDYEVQKSHDPHNPQISLYRINMARDRDRYRHEPVDQQLGCCIEEFNPQVVHIGHLNHLSTSMIEVISTHKIPILFTLHDYWLMCPRGQFLQTGLGEETLWQLCDGQEDHKCATKCYSRYFSGIEDSVKEDSEYWTNWVRKRMKHIKEMVDIVQLFVAPSMYLYNRFINEFHLQKNKVVYIDYGFDMKRLSGRKRNEEDAFVFGYIGTHIPAKGIQHLIKAFGQVKGEVKLRIFGMNRSQNTLALKTTWLPIDKRKQIEWLPEYQNKDIINQVFNRVDAIVVPSIWDENSALVIHEAQQARVPVITANHGGMKEYVSHEVNGLLFQHRNVSDLARQMQRLVKNPEWAKNLGNRGYIYSQSGDIPSIEDHVTEVVKLYEQITESSSE